MNRFYLFVSLVSVFGATCVVSVVERDISSHKSALMNTNIALVNADPYTTGASKHNQVIIDPSRLIDQAELDRGADNKIEDSRDPFFTSESGKLRPRLQKGEDADDWANEKPKFAARQASNAPLSRSKRETNPIVGCRNNDDDGDNTNRARGWRSASRRASNTQSGGSGGDDDDSGSGDGYGGGWGGRGNWGGWGSRGRRSSRGGMIQRSRNVNSNDGRRVIVSNDPSTIEVIPQQQAMIIQQQPAKAVVTGVQGVQQQANGQIFLPVHYQTIIHPGQTLPNLSAFSGQTIIQQQPAHQFIYRQSQVQPTFVQQQQNQPGQAVFLQPSQAFVSQQQLSQQQLQQLQVQ